MEVFTDYIVQYLPDAQVYIEILREHKDVLVDVNSKIIHSLQQEKGVELTFNRLVITLRFIWEALETHDMDLVVQKLKKLFPLLQEIPLHEIYTEHIPPESQDKIWSHIDHVQTKVDIDKIHGNLEKLNTNISEFLKHIENARSSLMLLCINLL
jgi:hypothetical protein